MDNETVKNVPNDYASMMEIVFDVLKKHKSIKTEQLACEIADTLVGAGYGRLDTFSLAMQDQLRHGLTGLKENLSKIREGISFIELTEEKCGRILRLLEHDRKRRGA
ncbi:MAG: hypothetical protein HS130_07725 [Deltaproteobacteria bacterium]|nr:hypothetical protein [Deltaproteobacteria bacterium]MCL4873100.1 hypothetical protein [bacterium]